MAVTLITPVSALKGVGKAMVKRLKNLNLETVEDLLWYVPFRYDDFQQVVPIAQLQADMQATVQGALTLINNRRSWRSRKLVTEAIIEDETGSVRAIWFNQAFLTRTLAQGDKVSIAGRVKADPLGLQFTTPQWEKMRKDEASTVHTGRLVPVYPATAGVTPKQIRYLISQALPAVSEIRDWLPPGIAAKHRFIVLQEALREMHFPTDAASLARARSRMAFEELFPVQFTVLLMKKYHHTHEAPVLTFHQDAVKQFVDALPYPLTPDQKKVAWQIMQDMQQVQPMRRLVQGDVGSGKTVVAALAAWHAITNCKRVLYMAPTEVLAQQQFKTLIKLFEQFPAVRVALLTSAQKKKDALKKSFAAGEYDIVVGTHALIQEDVHVPDLALVIVDEQHRFGVRQRQEIGEPGVSGKFAPHFLSMTATPIPRTYALVLYGDLDVSIIRTKPIGRKPIITRLVTTRNRERAYEFMHKELTGGRQAFVICPLIDESDVLGVKSVTQEYERLHNEVFPEFNLAMLHGKMKAAEKAEIMDRFAAREYAALVSTSVIEVGIDVPNATIMLIEGAERFGLAQLHQFRGRVGRGSEQSYCFVSAENANARARERLEFFATCGDGFELAQYDMELRGAGELYGTTQSGYFNFQIASLSDTPLVERAASVASELIGQGFGISLLDNIHFAKKNRGVHLE